MADHHSASGNNSRRSHHEGPRNHYLSFALSIILTAIAFATVNAGLSRAFTIAFILVLAVVQVLFQLFFWMHMKDKGHFYARIGIACGAFIALTAIIAAVYWMWW